MKDINVVGDRMIRNGCKMTSSKSCLFNFRTDFIYGGMHDSVQNLVSTKKNGNFDEISAIINKFVLASPSFCNAIFMGTTPKGLVKNKPQFTKFPTSQYFTNISMYYVVCTIQSQNIFLIT